MNQDGVIDEPIDDRSASTRYSVINVTRSLRSGWITTLDLHPLSGRTHQLRRHLAHLRHPIVGDQQYGVVGHILRSKGLFLWATELAFEHPLSKKSLIFSINEPQKFDRLRQREENRWMKFKPTVNSNT